MASIRISPELFRALRYATSAFTSTSSKPIRWCTNFRSTITCQQPQSALQLHVFYQRRWNTSSNKRWQSRQVNDHLTKLRKVEGLRSRASFKLMEMNHGYKLFKAGMTVVDLGYAPGSWTEVAVAATKPGGRVLGVDIIPALPPKGASSIQGNFQDTGVQHMIKRFLADPDRGRVKENTSIFHTARNYLERERLGDTDDDTTSDGVKHKHEPWGKDWVEEACKGTVDVLLSDMFGPWEQVSGFWMNSLTNPHRMMNTSGIRIRDHVGSMELCLSALLFGIDVLKPGGAFVCKFYAGGNDKRLEMRLITAFDKVVREKPRASRKESKEMFFVAKGFKKGVDKLRVLEMYSEEEEAEEREAMENMRVQKELYGRVKMPKRGVEDEWASY